MSTRGHWVAAGVCVCLSAALAGCAGRDIKALREFLQKPRQPVAGVEYRVLPPDVIMVSSQRVAEIDRQSQQIRPDGKINLPLVGEVFVAGMTPREIEARLIAAARPFYQEVDATVQVVGYNSQKVYIFGQVERPGPQPWTGCDSLLDILARVQPTYLAWPERIKVVRAGQPTRGGYEPYVKKRAKATSQPAADDSGPIPKPKAKKLEVNLMSMVRRGDMSRNILLYPDDIIYVRANPFGEVGLALQTMLFPVRPILETVRVPSTVQQSLPGGGGGGGNGGGESKSK